MGFLAFNMHMWLAGVLGYTCKCFRVKTTQNHEAHNTTLF
jgi:hypothetical protein